MYSDNLKVAIAYLQEIDAAHPGARLEEYWYGYECMELRFVRYRPENDAEYDERMRREASNRKAAELAKNEEHQKNLRREQYLKLKREFG
jgi:hypothetical protein